jgi:hypothetical protein
MITETNSDPANGVTLVAHTMPRIESWRAISQ